MQPTIQRPDYWNNLGSSKSRTAAQEEKAKELIGQIVEDSPQDTVFAFYDGSCRRNPGPCGAGAGVFFPGQEEHVKVSKVAKIRNRYNQVPHLTQDTNGKVTNSQKTPQTRAKRSALSQQVTTKHI